MQDSKMRFCNRKEVKESGAGKAMQLTKQRERKASSMLQAASFFRSE